MVKLLSIGAVIIASCFVMMLHEIPKTILFFCLEKRKGLGKQLIKSYQFIDPIGLIFCIAGFGGFSKTYMLRTKKDKNNIILGITGYLTLLIISIISLLICKFGFPDVTLLSYWELFVFMIVQYLSILSLGMFIVNLFPLMTFDMGLIISGVSREKYFSIIRNDYFIKMILVLSTLLGIIRMMSINGFLFFYGI